MGQLLLETAYLSQLTFLHDIFSHDGPVWQVSWAHPKCTSAPTFRHAKAHSVKDSCSWFNFGLLLVRWQNIRVERERVWTRNSQFATRRVGENQGTYPALCLWLDIYQFTLPTHQAFWLMPICVLAPSNSKFNFMGAT